MSNIDHQPLSIEQACNKLAAIKAGRPDPGNAPITTALPKDRERYLRYCISFCRDRKSQLILKLRLLKGASYERIALFLQKNGHGSTTVQDVQEAEAIAIKRVKDALARSRQFDIPIIGSGS